MNNISLLNAISVRFDQPWLLLLIIPALGLMLIPYFRIKKQRRRTVSRVVSLVIHSLVILLCAFMVSGMRFDYSQIAIKSDVIVLVDASDSTIASRDRMNEFVESVAKDIGDDYRLGIVTFANGQVYAAELDRDADKVYSEYMSASSAPDGSATDIASALYYARDMLKVPSAGRIIVLSDGIQTDGSALAAVKSIADGGTRVDSVYFTPSIYKSEVMINDVEVPEGVSVGSRVQITVTVQSASACKARLYLYDNGAEYGSQNTDLVAGENAFSFDYTLLTPTLHEFRVEIVPVNASDDTFKQNNVYYSYIAMDSSKRILIVDGSGNDAAAISDMLAETYDVTVCGTIDLPTTVEYLARYHEVILANVANADLPTGYGNILTEYVEIYGGGLFTVGGDRAYQEEDMKNSALQDLLPVEANTDAKSLGLLLVIDSSGSMRENGVGSTFTRMELAKEAAEASVDVLAPDDYLGVISFNATAKTVVEMTQITRKETIKRQIQGIQTATGTRYDNAMEAAFNTLVGFDRAEKKHIIFLTDGEPVDPDKSQYKNTLRRMAQQGITVSVVALGVDNNDFKATAEEIAEIGSGRYYAVTRGADLLPIMIEETTVAVGKYENNDAFTPEIVNHTSSAVIGITELPELGGFYGTRIKNGATMVLGTEGNPVYAEWRPSSSGGRVGSFMSDLNGTWSDKFIIDPNGVRFILNAVGSLLSTEQSNSYSEYRAEFIRDNYTTELRVYSEVGEVSAQVTSPDGASQTVSLSKVTDNLYAGQFASETSGIYTVEVIQSGNVVLTAHTTVSYSDEYRMFADDTECFTFMETLGINGNGQLLFNTENMFGKNNEVISGSYDPRLVFLIVALVLFLLDIVVRKFRIDRLVEIMRERAAAKKAANK